MAALILIGTSYYMKAIQEEIKILAAKFGEAFAEHKRRTDFSLPGL